ncbi:class I SAM-dependent methyltransferase [Actinomycetospora termitidis]|uniref:Methyltransferase domain-containing protein n=1 Tax=Actinomycetospora termitidis TaxID=3053470 RepID=A0ABT7MB41_9PSEU|nr:methyltransferase domain-containing protein [Actinomycetospora sp. Odt1-22]MDL5157879.1 methyltransferase domain-containing protein [Actinomycetospora sp. Odt1-22]
MPPDPADPARVEVPTRDWRDDARFAAQFVRAPVATASVWPSSSALARAVADAALGPEGAPPADGVPSPRPPGGGAGGPVVVELGAGSGAFTHELARRLGGRGRHLAVELNPALAHRLAERLPAVEVVPADVAELPTLLAVRGLPSTGGVDVVVSGLGWSATRPGRDDSLLPVVASTLARGGVLVQFGYTFTRWAAPARALERELRELFGEVTTTPTVWRNLPPAIVHRAAHPART